MRRKKGRVPWWLIFLLILNLLIRIIPQEWISGSVPTKRVWKPVPRICAQMDGGITLLAE